MLLISNGGHVQQVVQGFPLGGAPVLIVIFSLPSPRGWLPAAIILPMVFVSCKTNDSIMIWYDIQSLNANEPVVHSNAWSRPFSFPSTQESERNILLSHFHYRRIHLELYCRRGCRSSLQDVCLVGYHKLQDLQSNLQISQWACYCPYIRFLHH